MPEDMYIYALHLFFLPLQPSEQILEWIIFTANDEAGTLCSERIIDAIVALVVVAIGFETESARRIDQIFDIEVSDEIGGIGQADAVGTVAIAEVATEDETVAE